MRPLLVLFLFPCFVYATSVDNEVSKTTDTRNGRRLENAESLQLKKGQDKRSTVGKDSRSTKQSDTSNSTTETISFEIGASALLIPLLQELEVSNSHAVSAIAKKVRDCSFLTKKQAVPIATFFAANMLLKRNPIASYHASLGANAVGFLNSVQARGTVWEVLALKDPTDDVTFTIEQFNAMPRAQIVRGEMLYEAYPFYRELDGSETIYRVRPTVELVQCYFTYGLLLQETVKRMATVEGSRIAASANGNKTIVSRLDLYDIAARALEWSLRSDHLGNKIIEHSRRTMFGGCVLPTSTGLAHGQTNWSCGALRVDPESATATLGGMQIIAENTFMGERVMFAQSIVHAASSAETKSSATCKSSDNSTTASRETTTSKTRTTVDEQSTGASTATRASTSARPR
jgi:hypothetical protein